MAVNLIDQYKWNLTDDFPGRRLQGNPKVVTECEYNAGDENRRPRWICTYDHGQTLLN